MTAYRLDDQGLIASRKIITLFAPHVQGIKKA
jgi:hypothetical protein